MNERKTKEIAMIWLDHLKRITARTTTRLASVGLGLGVASLVGIFSVPPLAAKEAAFERALASIEAADLTRHGALLSLDELKGRDGGSEGEKLAAFYIASEFRRLGLKPGGLDGTYFQPFTTRKKLESNNVIGLLPGTDPELKNEYIVVGGHYDHIGVNREGEICNGADDNASGSSAVLEVAEAFLLHPPRRSVLFMAFGAEEQGLLGSAHYCAHPIYPLAQTVAMVNLDMIGRSKDDYLFIGGAGTSPVFRPLIEELNQQFDFNLEIKNGGGAPSDNMQFFLRGIPVLFLFTGIHPDYNQPSDDWNRINLAGLEKIARFAFSAAMHLANRDERPEFVRDSDFALPDAMIEEMGGRRRGR